MAPFLNPLRHIWCQTRAPALPSPVAIANLDGISDSETSIQQSHGIESSQHQDGSPPAGHQLLPSVIISHQDGAHSFEQGPQESDDHGQGQYDTTSLQVSSRSANDQLPRLSAQQSLPYEDDISAHCINQEPDDHVLVKQEPAAEGVDDDDIFAEFTNQDFHDDDAHTDAEHRQASSHLSDVSSESPRDKIVIKQEKGNGEQLPNDLTEQADRLNSMSKATRDGIEALPSSQDHTVLPSSINAAETPFETNANTSAMSFTVAYPQPLSANGQEHINPSQLSMMPSSNMSDPHFSFEQQLSNTQQPTISLQAALLDDTTPPTPSAGTQRHSSEHTALSLTGMDLSANSSMLAEQWKQRHHLAGMNALSAEAVHANLGLLHGPVAVQHQCDPGVVRFATQSGFATQAGSGQGRATDAQHGTDMRHLGRFNDGGNGLVRPEQMQRPLQPGDRQASGAMMQQPSFGYQPAYPQQEPVYPRRTAGVQEAESCTDHDSDEPSATHAPHHQSTTTRHDSLSPSKPASRPPGTRAASVISLSSDNDSSSPIEPISWKLPTHEATYHAPSTTSSLPSATVSLPHLVRETLLLTEDHSAQEMQLLLNVFLPAQRALSVPDPEPAHAVLNFHTIAVMVLEAYVQYEIGDEMGRGYGFHGGNSAVRPHPSTSTAHTSTSSTPFPAVASEEPPRIRSATSADVDDIFFAVVDRWRAGLAAGSQMLQRIRGCQEFCDVALDVIHSVKEHGLLAPEKEEGRKRKERSDKGVVRGPKGGGGGKGEVGTKRKADAIGGKVEKKVNPVESRKKAKTETEKAKTKGKGKGKVGAPKLTVTPRKK